MGVWPTVASPTAVVGVQYYSLPRAARLEVGLSCESWDDRGSEGL
jgi:hypothetical protein